MPKYRCVKCNTVLSLLKKEGLYELAQLTLKHIENRQPYRCNKCRREYII